MYNHVANCGRKALLKQIFSVFLIFTLYFNSFNTAYAAGGFAPWTITNTVAQGASTILTGSKEVILNGAKKIATGTAKITPTAAQVSKVLARGAAGYALSVAVEQLLGAVDWVLDPANNQIVYTKPETNESGEPNLGPLIYYPYSYYNQTYNTVREACQAAFDKGYIDTIKPAIFGNVVGNIRFSNYLSEEEFGEVIMRLRQYYDVGYTEATYYLDKQMFYFNFVEDNSAIVRVFPLEDYYKLDPDNKMETYKFGIIYINEEDKFQMQEIDTAFDYIPDETNDSVIYTKDTTPISVGVKPVKFCEENAETTN